MKNLLRISICSAVLCPLLSSGQSIDVTNPDNTGLFHDYVSAMYSDVSDLYAPPGYNDFDFTYTNPTTGDFTFPATGTATFSFKLIAVNPPSFSISGNNTARIGYFGNESWDINSLKVKDLDNATVSNLFTYDISGGVAPTTLPQSATISVGGGDTDGNFAFYHDNPATGLTDQSNLDRFRFFQAYDGNVALNYWIVGIDDRENDLVDYDDGFFFLHVVPEPSHIAALSMFGLGLLLVARRRMKAKK